MFLDSSLGRVNYDHMDSCLETAFLLYSRLGACPRAKDLTLTCKFEPTRDSARQFGRGWQVYRRRWQRGDLPRLKHCSLLLARPEHWASQHDKDIITQENEELKALDVSIDYARDGQSYY